jgi:hypothetical protein
MRIYTTEKFIQRAQFIHGDLYDYSEVEYDRSNKKVKITCRKHNIIFKQTPHDHLNYHGCPICGKEKARLNTTKTTETFISKANIIHNFKYSYKKAVYSGVYKLICITCPIHGDFLQIPNCHLNGNGCSFCGRESQRLHRVKSKEQFVVDAIKIHGIWFDYNESVYIRGRTKIKIKCPIHGFFKQSPANHLNGNGCPNCFVSRGEKAIYKILENLHMIFETQTTINECRNKRVLPFDFGVFDKNNKLYGLIEYQGEQHYDSVPYWGGEETFIELQKRDKIKQEYCQKNNIPLLIIPYWYFSKIEELVANFTLDLKQKKRSAETDL